MGVFDKASLALVPDGIKDGKLYSVKPTDGSGDFTFDRGSDLTATRVDENGLIEKGRGNLLTYSNEFATSPWGVNGLETPTTGESGYDGSTDAWLLETSTSSGRLRRTTSLSGVNTFSFYAKKGNVDYVAFFGISPGSFPRAWFNLATGNISNQLYHIDVKMEIIGNGWYRCSITFDEAVTELRIYPTNTAGFFSAGAGETSIIQDAQIEQGLVATDYIETGATTAQAGILEDLPRIDYTGGTPSLLLEPSRTNLITNSEYFGDYNNSNSTDEANATTSPEGITNATSFLEAATTGQHKLTTSASFDGSSTYTFSIFAKSNGRDLFIDTQNSNKWGGRAWFDLTNGTANAVLGTANIENFGNGWYRCSVTGASTLAGGNFVELLTSDGSTNSTTGYITKGVFIYGAQLEQGSYPTSYIPTYGAIATRGAETIPQKTINPTSNNTFTVFFELNLDNMFLDSNEQFLFLKDFAGTTYQSFRMFQKSSIDFIVAPYFDVDTTYPFGTNGSLNRTDTGKIVLRANGDGSYDMFIGYNGTTNKRSGSGLTAYNLGKISFSGNTLINLKSCLVFDDPLSDAECITLTT